MILAEAVHSSEGLWSEVGHLLTNPAHWIFEYVTAIPGVGFGYWRGRRHDRKHVHQPDPKRRPWWDKKR
jgi:hypothetical protein